MVRLPRIGWAAGQAEREARRLPELAPRLPLAVPVPLAQSQRTLDELAADIGG